jgi:hypothetical protein
MRGSIAIVDSIKSGEVGTGLGGSEYVIGGKNVFQEGELHFLYLVTFHFKPLDYC